MTESVRPLLRARYESTTPPPHVLILTPQAYRQYCDELIVLRGGYVVPLPDWTYFKTAKVIQGYGPEVVA